VADFPIAIFADFSCPYSYVSETALRRASGSEAAIHYRAYELYPEGAPLEPPVVGDDTWRALAELGATTGLRFERVDFRPRTRKAHEASLFARTRDRERQFRERIYEAYWSEGRDIGRIDVLAGIAETAGLDPEELKIALDIDRFAGDVRHDQEVGHRLRIPGTPTIFLGTGRSARVLVGAHGIDTLGPIIDDFERTWTPTAPDG
jgi:predicted DsbA family dithiol-disulfide isomerase